MTISRCRLHKVGRQHETQQAFLLLWTVFTVAPIIFGIDKFTNVLVDWTNYLAPLATQIMPVTPQNFMFGVGVVEILAGLWWPGAPASAHWWWLPGWLGSS